MRALLLQPTSTAHWHALVSEAEDKCRCRLDEDLESYLVFLLMRFAGRPDLVARIMALEYLRGLAAGGRMRADRLRDVGDQCLLYSGLFPRRARRRLVKVSYFVDLGRTAYHQLSEVTEHGGAGIFERLSRSFVSLMDVLLAMRELGGGHSIDPVEAAELWNDTGSRRARLALETVTGGTPVRRGTAGDPGRVH